MNIKDKNIQNSINIYKERYGVTKDLYKLKKLSYYYKDDEDFPEFISTEEIYIRIILRMNIKRIDRINQFIQEE